MPTTENEAGDASKTEEVISFVAGHLRLRANRLQPETPLKQFLSSGGEAQQLLQAFGDRFQVDMTECRIERYFGPQQPFNLLVWLWLLVMERDRFGFAPLTVNDMITAAQQKRWTHLGRRRR